MELPLSLIQAKKICNHYSYLTGKPLTARSDLFEPVAHVVIAPYDELNKWIFLEHFNETRDPKRALEFYKPPYFDVILLARFNDKEGYYYKDLRSYCRDEEVEFEMAKFTSFTDPMLKKFR